MMTTEEIKQFQETIIDTIMPIASNMTTKQIEEIINNVADIDSKFKNMLLEQILMFKSSKK